MRNASITNRSALAYLSPRTPADRRSLRKIAGYLIGVFAIVGSLILLKHIDREIRERTWSSAIASIEEGRPKLVSQGNSQGGGAAFYKTEVLVKFPINGALQERWITLGDEPHLLADVQFKIFQLKGTKCTVRWKPNQPDIVIAEAS